MYKTFLSENLKGRDHVENRRRWEYNIRMDLRELEGRYGLDGIRTSGGPS
jgi:hypothetical protein